ncbi:alpha/beta hydrolase [Roseateles sp. BYS96W]|uniref:Alpha/beta hydrolase n=1 Tax=Pelomonas nitida TaxID=3299027 RepID=A0ABW7G423_9BURK
MDPLAENARNGCLVSNSGERFIGTPLGRVDLERLRNGLRHPGLILHDLQDRTVPFAAATALHAAWPGSTLVQTANLGHRRLLADTAVIAQTAAFLATGKPA